MADNDKQVDVSQLKFNKEMNLGKKDPKKYSPTAIMRPKTRTYPVEEIFFDIEGDPDNIIMKIPEAIAEDADWKEGDTISLTMLPDRQGFVMKKIKVK